MNLDELKMAWKEYDLKLQASQHINEKILTSMIRERSRSRIMRVQRRYIFGFILMLFWLLICIATLFGNPFDFKSELQYAPIAALALCFTIILGAILKAYQDLQRVDVSQENLESSLRKVIQVYQKPQKLFRWTIIAMFSASLLFPLSFLPVKLEEHGFGASLGEFLIPMAVGLVVFLLGVKLGFLKEKTGRFFQEDLNELNELKANSAELLGE